MSRSKSAQAAVLAKNESISITEAAERIGVSKQSASKSFHRLYGVKRNRRANAPAARTDRQLFDGAVKNLRELSNRGFQLYVAGSGTLCLMNGNSHDESGAPRRDRVVMDANVPGMGGGDW